MPVAFESERKLGSMNTGTINLRNLTNADKEMLKKIHNFKEGDILNYELTKDDRRLLFNLHREKLGRKLGFDGNLMFMADQDSFNPKKEGIPHGRHFEITKDYVATHPNGWSDIPEDILVVTKKVPGVVIGHPVADCPVVMLSDKKQGISVVAHCGGAMIDAHLPEMLAEVLLSSYGSSAENVFAYVSACAGDSWTYDKFPGWARDRKIWDHLIYQGVDGKFHINIRPAVLEQLLTTGLEREKIIVNQDDTIKSSAYYSNSAASPYGGNDPTREGRHFAGIFYTDKDDGKITIRGPHK